MVLALVAVVRVAGWAVHKGGRWVVHKGGRWVVQTLEASSEDWNISGQHASAFSSASGSLSNNCTHT
jgi:hypothetical protein